jgi:hypothetical protein
MGKLGPMTLERAKRGKEIVDRIIRSPKFQRDVEIGKKEKEK